ncbi:MAG: UvrD-helicase domain-containing protein [Clostridia bacterium]|nr:UvrD-helicase domain-containing protein [Clostridia bacterium]
MAEKEKRVRWTPMQQLAIDTRDKTLLVSAAAGSGKTATLTERILQSITDKDNPIGIEAMLIVTFTRAAAGQLREKIGKAIRKKLDALHRDEAATDAEKRQLEKQLHALPSAKICTIDSFCTDILRANADRVNISSSFRIPDGAECALIGERILDGIFHDIYSGNLPDVATAEELSSLADCLTDTGKDSSLAEIISSIYLSTVSTVEGVESFSPLVEEYDPEKFSSVEATRLGGYVMERLHEMADYFAKEFKKAKDELLCRPATKKTEKLVDFMDGYLGLAEGLSTELSYSAAREKIKNISYPKTESNTDPDLPQTTQLAKYFRDSVEKDIARFFAHTEDEWKIAYAGLYREFSTLLRLLKRYRDELRAEKMRRNICEFSDIERYTYECLWQDGRRTDIAEAQSRLFEQIYIDEYQDVNDLQDRIFEAISTPTNRFMVGDIKQSIYRFRGGNPDIFSRMKSEYPELSVAKSSPRAVIFMSDNFRCDRGIVDFTNLIFDRVFGFIGESIGYVAQDKLHCSKYSSLPDAEPPYRMPEVCLIDNSALISAHKDDPNWNARMLAPYVVAEKIKELCATGKRYVLNRDEATGEPILDPETGKPTFKAIPIEYGDIAILMRKAKGRINNYKSALDEYGIPNAIAEDTRFFLTPEALLALCLLNAIDNPHRDIYLAGLMLSPLYSFTEDELAIIKRKSPSEGKRRGWETDKRTLYDSLTDYVREHPDYKKGKDFLQRLAHYRIISQGMPADALMLRLYNETGILALAAKNGTKDRLLRLYEYARSYESGSYKGLYNFISYVNSIIERKNSLDKREAPSDPTAVKIITSHGSKGLEYPIVFYVGSEDELGRDTDASRFEYAEGFGIGMYLRSKSGVALVKNPTKQIIKDFESRRELEEEARILYVALTRAEEQLYIVTPTTLRGKSLSGFYKDVSFTREHLGKYPIYGVESMSRLMFVSANLSEKLVEDFLEEIPPALSLSGSDERADTPPSGQDKMQTNIDVSDGAEDIKAPAKFNTGIEMAENSGFIAPTETRAGELEVPDPYRLDQILPEMRKRFGFQYPRLHLTRLPEKVSVSALYPRLLDGTDEGVTVVEVGTDTVSIPRSELSVMPAAADADVSEGFISTDAAAPADGCDGADAADADEKKRIDKALHFRGLGIKPAFISGEETDTATKRGIATHLLFQFCNLKRLKAEGAAAEISHLVSEKYLSDEDARRIATDRLSEVEAFRSSALIDKMIEAEAAGKLYREFRFNLLFPAEMFVSDGEARELYRGEKILVQGVIDCLYVDGEGEYHLLDYKTDRLTRRELESRHLARYAMCRAHARQLAYYGIAVEAIFGKRPITREVYSLHLGDTLSVVTEEYPL